MGILKIWNKDLLYKFWEIKSWIKHNNQNFIWIQWRRHGVDWGEHVPPQFPRSRFYNFSKPFGVGGWSWTYQIDSIFALAKKPPERKMMLEKVACPKTSKKVKNTKKGPERCGRENLFLSTPVFSSWRRQWISLIITIGRFLGHFNENGTLAPLAPLAPLVPLAPPVKRQQGRLTPGAPLLRRLWKCLNQKLFTSTYPSGQTSLAPLSLVT